MAVSEPIEARLAPILDIIERHPDGISLPQIRAALDPALGLGNDAVKYRVRALVDSGRVQMQGVRRWATYVPVKGSVDFTYSKTALQLCAYIGQPLVNRKTASYDGSLIESYEPNTSRYLTIEEQHQLAEIGTDHIDDQPAGTYARRIMDRLLIDLSWNSSRLEGNTYSLLDTRRLIVFDEEAEGAAALDAQMIRNHKDAIEFLVENAEEVGFNTHTISNLHALLANNLLPNPMSAGRLRSIPVGISGSSYLPLDDPHRITAYFQVTLRKIAQVENPFEQAFMALLYLPYLQAFDDVNKRVSRMAANIPFVKNNLIPISFTDVPANTYSQSLVGFYECGNASMMKDLFLWAYERSAQQYKSVRQQLGAPDPFRMKYREALQRVVRDVVLQPVMRRNIGKFIKTWVSSHVPLEDQSRFRDVAEVEVISLHEGNYARYRLRLSEFNAWKALWDA